MRSLCACRLWSKLLDSVIKAHGLCQLEFAKSLSRLTIRYAEDATGVRLMPSTALDKIRRELAALEDPKMREVNERRGDDHGVNLTNLRALAKRLKTQHELAVALWTTGDTAARLLATLVCKPKAFSAAELDSMVRDIRSPKLLDWFIVNVVKPGRHAEELRRRWKDDDNLVGRAGWSLTTERVVKNSEGVDLEVLLD
jgi:3-methyladenine DNA glycosylase AlkD